MISVISIVLYASTAVLIVPFISIYTAGLNDVNYYAPTFAILLTISSLIFCLRYPYHSVIIAAGKFKETRVASYGEAIINIILSIILVRMFGLIGVAIGTVVAIGFRFIFYVSFLSNDVLKRPVWMFLKRGAVNIITFIIIFIVGNATIAKIPAYTYITWLVCGLIIGGEAVVITTVINCFCYKEDFRTIIRKALKQ